MMKINPQEFNNIPASRMSGALQRQIEDKTSAKQNNRSDTVDTSPISHMMSKNAKEIASLNTIRDEKIEAFKSIVTNKADFSDTVIDKILYKLTTP